MMKFFTVFTFVLLLSTNSFSSEHYTNADAAKLVNGSQELWFKTNSPTPNYIRFQQNFGLSENDVFSWLRDEFKLPAGLSFIQNRSITSDDQVKHVVYNMSLDDVPFEFLKLTIHSKNGFVTAISGNIVDQAQIQNVQSISQKDAIEIAINTVGSAVYKWEVPEDEKWLQEVSGNTRATFYPQPALVIISNNADYSKIDLKFAYKMNIYSHLPVASEDIYIDAERGNVLFRHNAINEVDSIGYANTGFSNGREITTDFVGNEFFLRESGRGNGIHTWNMKNGKNISSAVDFKDVNDDNNWQFLSGDLDAYATDAHWGQEVTYDYLEATFGRNSIDDNGFALNSYIHYDEAYNNAMWDRQLKIMMFGDGPNNLIPLTTLDIVGHEIGHGLTQFTADLIYQNESGALNESFSDILGNCAEYFGKPESSSWRIGEDRGSFIRDMSFPNTKDNPDTYKGDFWYTGVGDNGGVHINSGVQNYWFYLLSEGGNGMNDNDYSYNVNGIGIINAALIAYRTLNVYLTSTSDYEEASFFSAVAAKDIFGSCSPQHEATVLAWNAVGLMNNYIDYAVASFEADIVDYCNLPFTVNFNNKSINGESYIWVFTNESTSTESTSTESNPSHVFTKPGHYSVKLTIDGKGCGTDEVVKNNLVTASLLESPVANAVSIYKGDSTLLDASVMIGEVFWYDDQEATILIGQGNTFQSPKLDASKTYYVRAISDGTEHETGLDIQDVVGNGLGDYSNLNIGIKFSTFQNIVLYAITVKAESAGERSFTIKDENGVVIFNKSVDLSVGVQEIVLDAEIPLGPNFVLEYTGSVKNLWMANKEYFPFEISGLISINGNTMDLPDAYPFFFNWIIKEQDCKSDVNGVLVSVQDINTIDKAPYKFYVNNSGQMNYFIDFFFKQNTRIAFGLYGINGQLVYEVEKEYTKGNSTEDINALLALNSYPSGVYFITIAGGSIEETEKIVNKGGSN